MANTYTQIHVQFVFAVKYRAALIHSDWKKDLHRYITAVFESSGHKMLQINGVADHIHILGGIRPVQSLSSLVQHIKTESSKWIGNMNFCSTSFAWQQGFGAFSYSKSHVPNVIRYIQNQEAHHKKETFLEEYCRFLKAFDIEYEKQYIFRELE